MSERCSAALWLDRFFADYYRTNPVNATFIGMHQFDDQLPRHPSQDRQLEAEELIGQLDGGFVDLPMDTTEELDVLLARAYLRSAHIESTAQLPNRNPCFYTGEAVFGIVSLFLRDFAPLAQRVDHATARLRQIPRLLNDGIPAVQRAPEAWVERAIDECDGAERLLREGIAILTRRKGAIQTEMAAARNGALLAFADYRRRLAIRDIAVVDAPLGIGHQRFDRLLREAHFLDMTGDEVGDYARDALRAAHAHLESDLAAHGYRDWPAAAEAMAEQHPTADGYLDKFQEVWNAARQHAIERELLTWPAFPVVFESTPDWARSAAPHLYFLNYRSPPAFDDGQVQRHLAPPVDGVNGDEQERILRAVNDTQITLNHVVHHAGIGHHVQNWHAARSRSRVGRMAGNDCALRIAMPAAGTLVEGWACYATDLMEESGFLTPLQRLSMRHARTRMAARAIVDVELHAGRISLEDATAFYVRETGMTLDAARAEAVKNAMFPTMAMIYLIGTDLIHDLRGEMADRWGDQFSLRRFHDEFLSWGAIPITLIGRLMRDEPLEPSGFSARQRG